MTRLRLLKSRHRFTECVRQSMLGQKPHVASSTALHRPPLNVPNSPGWLPALEDGDVIVGIDSEVESRDEQVRDSSALSLSSPLSRSIPRISIAPPSDCSLVRAYLSSSCPRCRLRRSSPISNGAGSTWTSGSIPSAGRRPRPSAPSLTPSWRPQWCAKPQILRWRSSAAYAHLSRRKILGPILRHSQIVHRRCPFVIRLMVCRSFSAPGWSRTLSRHTRRCVKHCIRAIARSASARI